MTVQVRNKGGVIWRHLCSNEGNHQSIKIITTLSKEQKSHIYLWTIAN